MYKIQLPHKISSTDLIQLETMTTSALCQTNINRRIHFRPTPTTAAALSHESASAAHSTIFQNHEKNTVPDSDSSVAQDRSSYWTQKVTDPVQYSSCVQCEGEGYRHARKATHVHAIILQMNTPQTDRQTQQNSNSNKSWLSHPHSFPTVFNSSLVSAAV